MVELLTDYTTQIYHALSTDARPDADPGAQLREIDTGKRFIFDGNTWNELPDGGGGGGGLPTGLSVMKTGTFTPAGVTGTIIITHDLGRIPKVFVLYLENSLWLPRYNDHFLYATMVTTNDDGTVGANCRQNTTNNKTMVGALNATTVVDETTIQISRSTGAQGAFQPVQYTNEDHTESEPSIYRWYAFA